MGKVLSMRAGGVKELEVGENAGREAAYGAWYRECGAM
jgi:hypothetical protein